MENSSNYDFMCTFPVVTYWLLTGECADRKGLERTMASDCLRISNTDQWGVRKDDYIRPPPRCHLK